MSDSDGVIRLGNVFLVNYTESSPNEEPDGRKITKMHFPQRKLSKMKEQIISFLRKRDVSIPQQLS